MISIEMLFLRTYLYIYIRQKDVSNVKPLKNFSCARVLLKPSTLLQRENLQY